MIPLAVRLIAVWQLWPFAHDPVQEVMARIVPVTVPTAQYFQLVDLATGATLAVAVVALPIITRPLLPKPA